jgi:hypothetical protein
MMHWNYILTVTLQRMTDVLNMVDAVAVAVALGVGLGVVIEIVIAIVVGGDGIGAHEDVEILSEYAHLVGQSDLVSVVISEYSDLCCFRGVNSLLLYHDLAVAVAVLEDTFVPVSGIVKVSVLATCLSVTADSSVLSLDTGIVFDRVAAVVLGCIDSTRACSGYP